MGSTMHVVALIDQKSRQNGIDYGTGRFRCEEGQFGAFRFKILPSARVTKYCHPFSEGDVVTLVGQFSYETVDKVEGFTLNVSVATPFPIPSSGCWEPEEIPLSTPYLSFNTQPVSGSLRQIDNCQFIRTKSQINSGYTRRYTDPRFRIGYQIDNDRWDNFAGNWDAFSQFFISGFFLHVDNGEVHIEATEIEVDPLTRKHGKNLNLLNSSNSTVPGVSPLAKNLARLLEQEKNSFTTSSSSGIFGKNLFEQTPTTKLSTEKKSTSLRPLAPKNSSGSLQQSQNQPVTQPDSTNAETLSKDLLKGFQAYQHIVQRIGNQIPGQSNSNMQIFSALQHMPLSEQQPSAEQIAELISDQGTRQDLSSLASGVPSKLPSYTVWPLQGQEAAIYNQRDKIPISPQVVNQNDREKSSTHQNERDKTSKASNLQQVTHQQELDKSPSQYVSSQNERELTPSQHEVGHKNDKAESESGESLDLDQSKKSGRKGSPEDKSKSVRPTSRATLGNRFIVYEPKVAQESEGNKQEGTTTGKRGRKSKNVNTARPNKKTKNKKNANETETTTTNPEDQVIDSTNESPKNSTDKDSKDVSEKSSKNTSENTTLKDDEGTNVDMKSEN